MGKEEAWAAVVGALPKTTDLKWSDVAKVAGAGLAVYVIGATVNGHMKVHLIGRSQSFFLPQIPSSTSYYFEVS